MITWGTTIGLTLDEGDKNGGTPVIDYTVMSLSYDSSTYIERQVGVVGTSITLKGFNLGITYTFKVKSRNAFDYSINYSNEVSILAATNPSQPEKLILSIDNMNVLIDWTYPNANGSPITSYKILITTKCSVPITTLTSTPYSLAWGS